MLWGMAQLTPRNAPGLRSRELKAIRVAAGLKQAQLLVRLEAAGRQLGIDVAPRTSLKRMVSGWENGAPMSADYRRLFAAVYGVTEADLGFIPKADQPPTPLGADPDPWELVDALTHSSIAPPTLAEMERTVLGYAHRYGSTPPAELYPLVSRQMTRMKDAISRPQPLAVRRQSVALLGVLSGVGGQLALDLHRPDRAEGMFSVGRLAATEAEDDDLAAWVAATQSIGPYFAQRYATAADLLAGADRLASRSSSLRRRAWIAAMHARALAAAGSRDQALTALTRAHHSIQDATDPAHGTDFFDAPRLDGITGSVYLLLRDPRAAEEFIRRSLAHRSPADAKGRALLTLDLAAARVLETEHDEAAHLIGSALDIAADAMVRPIIDRAHAVRRHMAGWTGAPAAELDARLTALTT
jgi:transcriptional regulator with XRE-family HTH domain/tetratricopeptide (TPR) repeat protein